MSTKWSLDSEEIVDYVFFMAVLEDIEREAISLPKDQRLKLAEKLISSVDEVGDTGVDEAWEVEISRRIESYRSGDVDPIPAADVFARLKEIAPE